MGQTCCGTKPDDPELNYGKTKGVKGDSLAFDPEKTETNAVICLQKHFRGYITRRAVREMYGFEARHTALQDKNTYPGSEAEIM